jgi:CRP/FNR family transcriptional regulator, cyclic AMP receptor protein
MNPTERPPSALKEELFVDFEALLASNDEGKIITDYSEGQIFFSQGDPANAVFYILSGKIKRTALSETGREAIIAVLGPSEFLGEGCLSGQTIQMSTATAMTPSRIVRFSKKAILQTLRQTPKFSVFFIAHLVSRAVRMEADLVDQLFNSSEKRLARVLLLLV